MKIKEILDQEDGFALGSIDRCNIKKIGVTKNDDSNCYQILHLEDNEGNELKVKLKYEKHFLDPKTNTERLVKFECGPPIKNKNTGLIVFNKDGNFRVDVTPAATVKYGEDKEPEEKPKPKPIEEKKDFQLTENSKSTTCAEAKEEQASKEKPIEKGEYSFQGPNDDKIVYAFYERLHILRVLERENEKNGNPFPDDYMATFATGVVMAMEKGGYTNKILPPKGTKPKFESFDKPHNPKNEPEEKKESFTETGLKGLTQALNALRGHNSYQVPGVGKDAECVGNQMLDKNKRPKMIRWYLSNSESSLENKPKSLSAWKGIHYLLRSLHATWETYIIMETLISDYIEESEKYKGKGYYDIEEKEADEMEEAINIMMKEKFPNEKMTPKQFASNYFSLPDNERRLAFTK